MSMTRREAAIKSCEDRIRHLESVPPHYYGKRQRGRAIELEKVKIKALRPVSREQVERVFPGCEYCTNNIKSRKEYITKEYPGLCDFEVFLDGSRTPSDIAVITYNHQTPFTEDICFSFPVLYCPHCGRPLTDEAVDIRLKELEALNDAGNQ